MTVSLMALASCTIPRVSDSTCFALKGSKCIYIDEKGKESIIDCAGYPCLSTNDYVILLNQCTD